MTEFKNVTVVKKANVYFDGKVTSRTVCFQDGTKKTLGYMLPGEYEFNTGVPEVMEVISGSCEAEIGGAGGRKSYSAGQSFRVLGNSKFRVKVAQGFDYCCSFEK